MSNRHLLLKKVAQIELQRSLDIVEESIESVATKYMIDGKKKECLRGIMKQLQKYEYRSMYE